MTQKQLVNVKDATLLISGYEFGPDISKIIISLSHPVENVSKDGITIIADTVKREISDIYLSNKEGDRVLCNSNYITIELAIIFDQKNRLFNFNPTTHHDEWVSEYITHISFHVIINGRESLVSFEGDYINNRICPATEQFKNRGTFSGQYKNPITKKMESLNLKYAAFEPIQLKEDNVKNPLIIWLNGRGEGGADIDIVLLGNKVTALASSEIQTFFTTENGENGSYVLVIQCPTYWMDDGDGRVSQGDLVSLYTEILMDMIKDYVSKNKDVDPNRIYLGGCSNGGYMAMNMLISYPNYWAASYQICEAYSYMLLKRDKEGNYIYEEEGNHLTEIEQTDKRWFTPDKINKIKNIPIWFVQSEDDRLVIPWRYSLPAYKELLKAGAKNCWYSYFESIEGVDIPGMKYLGHWSWVPLFNVQVTKVQDREKILASDDTKEFGFVPCNDGGGCQEAADENCSYKNIFEWLNAQVKH